MMGIDTLYDRLLLEQSPPTLHSDFHDLFSLVKHSPSHISSFNSKIFYSALLSDDSFPPALSKVLSNIWLRFHGFTSVLSIKLSDYLSAVGNFQLEKYFLAELRSLPDVLYGEVLNRIVRGIVSNESFVKLIPYVLKVDVLKCKTGISRGVIAMQCLEHVTQRVDKLDRTTVDMIVQEISEISFLVCYTGTSVVIRETSACCDVIDKVFTQDTATSSQTFDKIPPTDSVLAELHTNLKLTCCQFQTLRNFNTHFTGLYPVYEASRLFLDTLSVHAVCHNEPRKLCHLYSFCKYLLSDQLSRALYTSEHVEYIEKLLESVPDEHLGLIMSSPIYKALNFDPFTAEWTELVIQVKEGLKRANESFNVMMDTCQLNFSMIEDCIGLLNLLTPAQISLLFMRTLGADTCNIPLQQKILVTQNIMNNLKRSSAKEISSFSKHLYVESGFNFSQLDQFSLETKDDILEDHGKVTKTINQLGSKGTGKWKEKLNHSLLINFVLLPDKLLTALISQATRNKALSSAVAMFLREFLPFTLNPLIPISEVVFVALKSEFKLLKTLKDVKQFDLFIEILQPIVSHQTILKLLLLPLIKSNQTDQFTILTWLQIYLQREPFYNFSLFYELVRIWASPELEDKCCELLDDCSILDNLSAQIREYPKEAYLMLKMITQGWGFRAGLRFASIMEEPRVKIPKMVGDVDLSAHVTIDCVSFVEGDFRDERGEKPSSLALCLLKLAKYSLVNFKLSYLELDIFTESLFNEFSKILIRSSREWERVYQFLDSCFAAETLNLSPFLRNAYTGTSNLVTAIEKVTEVCVDVGIDILKYLSNDVLSFMFLSTVTGNSIALCWFSKVSESFNSKSLLSEQSKQEESLNDVFEGPEVECEPDAPLDKAPYQAAQSTRTFILLCVMLKVLQSKSLETLLLSMAPRIDVMSSDAGKAFTLLPQSLQSTLSINKHFASD